MNNNLFEIIIKDHASKPSIFLDKRDLSIKEKIKGIIIILISFLFMMNFAIK